MTTSPAIPAPPDSALALLFEPVEVATGPLAILSAEAERNLSRALENLPAVTRETAIREVRAAAAGLLDINLIDILLAGWRQYHDLTSAARRTLAAPGSSELVRLVTHRVTAAQEPYVNVMIDGRLVATVRFSVSVVFDVSALLAGISAGRLVAVHAGRFDITVTLAIDGTEVAARQARIELPGVIPLTPGIRLLAAGDYPAEADQPPAASQARGSAEQGQPSAPCGTPAAGRRGHPPAQDGRWWEAAGAG